MKSEINKKNCYKCDFFEQTFIKKELKLFNQKRNMTTINDFSHYENKPGSRHNVVREIERKEN